MNNMKKAVLMIFVLILAVSFQAAAWQDETQSIMEKNTTDLNLLSDIAYAIGDGEIGVSEGLRRTKPLQDRAQERFEQIVKIDSNHPVYLKVSSITSDYYLVSRLFVKGLRDSDVSLINAGAVVLDEMAERLDEIHYQF